MASNNRLVKEWIRYLKNNQIVHMQSDPKTGQLTYKRPVRTDDLFHFIQASSDFTDEQIESAIQSVVGAKGTSTTNTPQLGSDKNGKQQPGTSIRPTQQPTSADTKRLPGPQQQTAINGPADTKRLPGTAQRPAPKGPRPKNNDVTDIEYKDVDPARKKHRGLKEAFQDIQGAELSEDDVEKIFDILLRAQKPAEVDREDDSVTTRQSNGRPGSSPDETEPDNSAQIEKIKNIIDNTMTPEYRKMLWELLNDTQLNEDTVSKDNVNDILRSASSYSSFRSARGKISFNELHKAWMAAGAPLDTDKIRSILTKQFKFSQRGLDRIFNDAMPTSADTNGNQSSTKSTSDTQSGANPDQRATDAVENIANYIIKHGYTEEIKAYLEQKYPKEIKGLMNRMADAGKKMFKKFAKEELTYEDVKNVFLKIVEENLQPDPVILKQEEKTKLGRNKK